MLLGHGHWDPLPPTFYVQIENFEKLWILFRTFVGTALFPQGLWEQKIVSLLVVPTNLWEQLFPQRLWEHQMEASYWLFPQICRNRLLSIILRQGRRQGAESYIICQPILTSLGPRRSI